MGGSGNNGPRPGGSVALESLVEVFKTFGDLTRLKIIKLLMIREMCVGDLAEILGVSQPTVSQHLRRLKQAGLARERRDGQLIYYQVDWKAVATFREECREFLEEVSLEAISAMAKEAGRLGKMERYSPGRIRPNSGQAMFGAGDT
ncbi:MAG: metalloregulator ArsR/SmtB family transcription factor [Firmicutes bacterium]|nr:metalloregulator ArsR/SmtB family transcription factor [Bacillota bacterium]MCL5039279.1 metalloregulator ArsR/SmtB family transcription factor [Bacillota bacterium]